MIPALLPVGIVTPADPSFAYVQWLTGFENTPTGPQRDIPVVGQTLNFGGSTCAPSSTQKKFGTQSFDESGSNGLLTSTTWPTPGTGNWCMEGWVYVRNWSASRGVFWAWGNASSETGRVQIGVNNVGVFYMYLGATGGSVILSASGALGTGAWHFIQTLKVSGVTKLAIDGSQVGSNYTDSQNYTNANFYFGKNNYTSDNSGVDGYLDEWRYTVGAARTINLPTAVFPRH